MQSSTTGFEESKRFLNRAMGGLSKKIPYTLNKSVNKMVTSARGDHKFNTKSGQAERAIQGLVDPKLWSMTFWINPSHVTSGSYNYAWGLNDGTRSNYKKGEISPSITPSSGNGGIQADDFMGRAWSKEIKSMQSDIKIAITKAFK